MQEMSNRSKGAKAEIKEGDKAWNSHPWLKREKQLRYFQLKRQLSFESGTSWSTFQTTASIKGVSNITLMTSVHKYQQFKNITYNEPQVSCDFQHFLLSCWLYRCTVHHLLCLYYWKSTTLYSSLNFSLFHFWSIVHLGLVSLMLHMWYWLLIPQCNLIVL